MSTKPKSTAQQSAEAEVEKFRGDLGPFVVAAETTRMAMAFTDAKVTGNPIIFVNDSFLALTGYAREEVLGHSFNVLTAPGNTASALAELKSAFGGGGDEAVEMRDQRKDGSIFWADVYVTPVFDKAGETVQHFASLVDVTPHKLEEGRLQFLLDELNHRTQNSLATVQSIALQTLRGVAPDAVVATLEGRIMAMSRVHSLLGSDHWEAIGLRDVIEAILKPFEGPAGGPNRVVIEGDYLRLSPKPALNLAMVFHELATNAAKYGALSQPGGHINISWQVETADQGNHLHLQLAEHGGPPVSPPSRRGFGSRLIEGGLAQDLRGEVSLDFAPGGLKFEMKMPLQSEMPDE
jgi:PAS domain S-box-containing protein